MPLLRIEATHVRVVCDACRKASAEVCSKRDVLNARAIAIPKFQAVGWHHDAAYEQRAKRIDEAKRDGSGRWYCPECARRTHL